MERILEPIIYKKPNIILWEKTNDCTAKILRVYGDQAQIRLPDFIEGYPVKEIGAYCFSSSDPRVSKNAKVYQNDLPFDTSGMDRLPGELEHYPALCGKFPKAIYLPASVEVLHNAAFYNCRFLNTLSVGPEIRGIGSDEFTNCLRLTKLIVRAEDTECSGISLILERITTDLDIYFMPDSEVIGAIYFPDYYEMLDEVTPAHLFTRSINGIGFRMRKAFDNKVLDYGKYDACMDSARQTESGSVLWHLAFWRLSFPAKLEPAYRKLYEELLTRYFGEAAKHFIKERKLWGLSRLWELLSPDRALTDQALALATESEWAEGITFLMNQNRPETSFAERSFDFDLDF